MTNLLEGYVFVSLEKSTFMKKIFISYSQEDFKPEARFLANYLSRHLTDAEIFIDQMIPKGAKWREKINEKLQECNIFVVILTNGALKSSEVKKEITKTSKRKNCIIIPCKDEYLKTDWDNMPLNLSSFNGLDFERKEELGRKLVGEIKSFKEEKIRKQSEKTNKSKIKSMTISGFYPLILGSSIENKLGFSYTLSNGWIESVGFDRDAMSVFMRINLDKQSKIKLRVPRKVIDAKSGDKDASLFVLIKGEEITSKEKILKEERVIEFECPQGDNYIEIIGTQVLMTSFSGTVKKRNIIKIENNSDKQSTKNLLKPEKHLIQIGDKIRWVNEDSEYHTITSGTPSEGPNGVFDSSVLAPKTSFEIAFNQEGVFEYFDMINPWIVGKIIVK